MRFRRVITGHNEKGKAVVVKDDEVEEISAALLPGRKFYQLWGTDELLKHPISGEMPEGLSWFPQPHGQRFFIWVVPPKGEEPVKPEATEQNIEEVNQKLPGIFSFFEKDDPGMHTTPTVDMSYIISGEIVLELDDGKEMTLKEGDTIVQNGTRHRWFNRGEIPAVIITGCLGIEKE